MMNSNRKLINTTHVDTRVHITTSFILIALIWTYNVSTFAVKYYNFYFNCALVVITFISLMSINVSRSKLCVFSSKQMLMFILATFVISVFFYIKGRLDLWIVYFSVLWVILFSVTFASYLQKNSNLRTLELFESIALLVIIASAVTTTIILQQYPMASRAIGGYAEGIYNSDYLKSLGCGGYEFVYGTVIVLYGCMVKLRMPNTSRALRLFCLSMLIVGTLMVAESNYSTALLVVISSYIYVFFLPQKTSTAVICIIVIGVMISVLYVPVLTFLKNIAANIGLGLFSDKMELLLSAQATTDYSSLSRYQVFSASWESFLSNPVFGGVSIRGHSFVLDYLGILGAFSVIVFLYVYQSFQTTRSRIEKKYYIGWVLCYLFIATVDTYNGPTQLIMTFVLTPLLLSTNSYHEIGGI